MMDFKVTVSVIILNINGLNQGLANYDPQVYPLFRKETFSGTQPYPFVYILSITAFVLQKSTKVTKESCV